MLNNGLMYMIKLRVWQSQGDGNALLMSTTRRLWNLLFLCMSIMSFSHSVSISEANMILLNLILYRDLGQGWWDGMGGSCLLFPIKIIDQKKH